MSNTWDSCLFCQVANGRQWGHLVNVETKALPTRPHRLSTVTIRLLDSFTISSGSICRSLDLLQKLLRGPLVLAIQDGDS
jgi:hypothetical protein